MRATDLARRSVGSRRGQPLYQTIRDDLVERISAGEWATGIPLPSEQQLAKSYGVGISTVRAAVSQLVATDVLIRHQGKGTFVASHNFETDIYRFFHIVQDNGERSLPKSKLLSFEKCRADTETADLLRLPHIRPDVFHMRNLLLISGQAQAASDIWVPCTLLPDLTEEIVKSNQDTLYGMYQNRYGIMILRTREKIRARMAPSEISILLGVPEGLPLLSIRRIGYTFGDIPAEIRQSWVRTDVCHYEFEIGSSVDGRR